jgi:XTP/dITP diphosphohydrolase
MSDSPPASGSGARPIIVGTHNKKKAHELEQLLTPLGFAVRTLADCSNPLEVDETGATFVDNATLKATRQAAHLHAWVLADDSGLAVDALQGEPGVHSARYAGPRATDADNRHKLLSALQDISPGRRGAQFVCHLVLADPTGAVRATSAGTCRGRIRESESGTGGFGYDPLFEILEYHRTFGELSAVVKSVISHRARAIRAIVPQLVELARSGAWEE